jgi:hypothetical protein
MRGLSGDIQEALEIVVEGLNFKMDIDFIEPDKIKASMDSKLVSFRTAKELLSKWVNSPNAPSESKFNNYVEKLITSGESSIKTLRKALRAPINYSTLDTHKHKLAAQTKLLVLNSITELDSSLIELRHQFETGTVILKDAEFKRGFAEKFAYGEFFPPENYHKNWHNKEQDSIVIDPKGSRGEIIELDGLKIQLPHPPRDRSQILFSDKPKREQCWVREEIPKGLTPENVEVYTDYIMEQFRRRREGVWFMNNGTPTWLTGRHWMQLQWGKMFDDGIYPSYRHAQLLLFYHKEACYIDKLSMGQIFLKSRQTGYTYGMMSDSIELVSRTKGSRTGMTSMTDDDARRAFAKLSYTFQEWPFFFQPITKGKADSPTNINFGKPSNSTKEEKKKNDTTTDGYVNSTTDFEATKAKAYDGQHMKLYVGDECIFENDKIWTLKGLQKIVDVEKGDLVLCADGEYRQVMDKAVQEGPLYRVTQSRGKDYMVNGNHKLYLQEAYGERAKKRRNVFITPLEYLEKPKYTRNKYRRICFKGFYNIKEKDFFIDPYVYGAWLGDGSSKSSSFVINIEDVEIRDSINRYAESKGFRLKEVENGMDSCYQLYMSDPTVRDNRFINELRRLDNWGNKYINKEYLYSSRSQMLEVLAGIIDTDGSKSVHGNTYNVEMASKKLIEDIYVLAKHCGLCTSEVSVRKRHRKETETFSYRVGISDINKEIPVRTERKKQLKEATCTQSNKMDVEYEGVGVFVGLTLDTKKDEEALIVLEDFTLTKNCAKWERVSYIEHLNTLLPTTFRGGRVVGKVFLGSTMGKLDAGGEDFKTLYQNSKVKDRQPSGFTSTKLYSYFMPAHTNYEDCIDIYGKCWTETPPKGTLNTFGEPILKGSIQAIKELYADAKKQGDVALNAAYRAFPMTEAHAMRDEADACVFNLTKLTDQWDHNEEVTIEKPLYTRGNFRWEGDVKFSKVEFVPDKHGRFKIWWMPSASDDTLKLRNNVKKIRNLYTPMNDYGCIGVDCFGSYVQGKNKASKGAAHAFTGPNVEGVPARKFLFEYIDKPATQDIFNEDILMAAWFYGLPILAENNRRDFVRHLFNEQCRPFSMNRVDKTKLDGDDAVLGGQPMQSKDILDAHENGIRSFIQHHVGVSTAPDGIKYRPEGEIGDMPFNDTIQDWMKFNPNARTAHDATVSSGLAIMGCNKEKYVPRAKINDAKKNRSIIRTYDNKGITSTFKKQKEFN